MNTNRRLRSFAASALLVVASPTSAGERLCPTWPGQAGWLEGQMQRREARLAGERKRAIELLEAFLSEHPEAPQRADALFRLGELRWERAEASLLERMRRYEQQLEDLRSGAIKVRPAQPRIELGDSIRIYEELLEKHPRFARTDTVLYLYGFALNEQGDEEAALGVFRSLLSRFPDSSFAPDANLAIGEYHFAAGNFDAARESYAKVFEHIDSPLYDLALYKTAWCHFKAGEAKQAAREFKRVLQRDRRRRESELQRRGGSPLAGLEREALEDLALTFSEYGGASEAYRFMKQVGGEEYSIRVLHRLGEVFFRQARYDQAIESYRTLVERFPLAEQNPAHQERIAEAYQRAGDMERSLAERRKLAQRYGPGSSWVAKHADNPDRVEQAIGRAERALRFVALFRHQQAQQEKGARAYRRAAKAYREYLKQFGETEWAPQVHFHLGEVLFRLDDFERAAAHYGRAAARITDPLKRRDCAYAAVLSFDRLRRATALPDEPPDEPQRLTDAERAFIRAVEEFARMAEDDEKLPQLTFEVGRIYYGRGQLKKSAERLLLLVERSASHAFAEAAADLALDCFNRGKRWGDLERTARRFIERGWFAGTELGKQLPGLAAAAMFQSASLLAKGNTHAEAAERYLRLTEEFPGDELAAKALFNAAVSLEKHGDKSAAVEQYQRVIDRYPRKAADALFVIAGLLERQYDYPGAAEHYRKFARRFPDDERAADSALQAALLYRASRSFAAEARTLATFLRTWPRHPKAADVRFLRAAALGRAGDHRAAERTLRVYLRRQAARQGRVREASLHLGQALFHQRRLKQARVQLERCAAFADRRKPTGSELAAAAECRFRLGELAFAEYEKIQLRPPKKRLINRLKAKAAKLKQAEALFTKVVQAGHMEWASAALFRIGDMYARFAQSIYRAPLPKGLTARELEVYRQQLQSLAFPIEDKALSAFAISHQTAIKHAYFSVWSERTIQMLRKLDPARFPAENEVRPTTRWADSFTDYGLLLDRLPVPPTPKPPARASQKDSGRGKPSRRSQR